MTLFHVGIRVGAFFDRHRYARTVLLLVSVLAVAAILYLAAVVPLVRVLDRADIPDFPDCAGQPAPVVEYLKKMYALAMDSPASAEAVGNLGMAFHAHLFYDEADVCYRRAEKLNPEEWRWRYYVALLRDELGDTKATVEDLKEVVRRQPGLSQAWFRLGNAYLKTESFEDADLAYHQVLALPDDPPSIPSALRSSVRGAFPLKAYATLQLARIEFLQKRFAPARSLLEGVIEAHPTFGPAYRLLGNACHELGEEEKAADYEVRAGDFDSYVPPSDVLYNALVLCSRNTDFITRQINIAVKWENYEWTLALINHILEYSPHDAEALAFRIKLALDTQKIEELEPLLREYVGQFKSDEPQLLDMAKYLRYRGEYEASVAVLRNIITLNPKAIEAHIEFARMLQTFKQYDLGVKYCTEVMATDPRNPEIRIELADLLIHKGDLGKAVEELKAAQSLHPNEEVHSIMSGRIAQKRGDVQGAIRYFQQALTLNPRNGAAQLELGMYLLGLRRWREAAKHWQEALRESPNNIDFIEQYAWLLATCPDASGRDGKKALELANRLTLIKKRTIEQDIRCGIALAAAYAETQQFENALSIAQAYHDKSTGFRKKDYADQLESLIHLFESRKPFRL